MSKKVMTPEQAEQKFRRSTTEALGFVELEKFSDDDDAIDALYYMDKADNFGYGWDDDYEDVY